MPSLFWWFESKSDFHYQIKFGNSLIHIARTPSLFWLVQSESGGFLSESRSKQFPCKRLKLLLRFFMINATRNRKMLAEQNFACEQVTVRIQLSAVRPWDWCEICETHGKSVRFGRSVLGFQPVILIVLLFWIYFFLLTLVFVLQWLSLHWEILIMLLSQFPLTFQLIHNRMPHFIT